MLAIEPESFLPFAIRGGQDAEAMLLVEAVLALVPLAIRPCVAPTAMDDRIPPLPLVHGRVVEGEPPGVTQVVRAPITLVLRVVRPIVLPGAMLHALPELPSVERVVDPDFHTDAMPEVTGELALVDSVAALESVDAAPVGLAVYPLARVDVSIGMPDPPVAHGSATMPLAEVLGAIFPFLLPDPVAHVAEPLALVTRAGQES
mmetsp:Transcript_20211/g.56014  ORF Transcript_20211/g.56014 Transcript_20211/m.56014 type:complete len:203 (+) Transcript_20211:134-742(+)